MVVVNIEKPSLVPRPHPPKGGEESGALKPFLVFADSADQVILNVDHMRKAELQFKKAAKQAGN